MIQHKPVLASFGTKGAAALNDLGAHCCCWERGCRFEAGAAAAVRLQQKVLQQDCRCRGPSAISKQNTEYYIKSRIMISCWGSNCSRTAWGQNNCSTDIALEDNLTEIVTSMMKQISDNFKTTFNITSRKPISSWSSNWRTDASGQRSRSHPAADLLQ